MSMEQKFGPPPPAYDHQQQYPNLPPQPGFQQPQQQPMIQTMIVSAPAVGPEPVNITCPSCHSQISTRMQYDTTTRTHIMAGLLCMFGCFLCMCLPYCMDSCRNANHYCPNCNAFIGTYKN